MFFLIFFLKIHFQEEAGGGGGVGVAWGSGVEGGWVGVTFGQRPQMKQSTIFGTYPLVCTN